ncbi:MAG TPA: hypothetical protein VLZ72_07400, partial [Flavobacterium sp.]|nr:hypothetical protein [Flavobacterium sp.]
METFLNKISASAIKIGFIILIFLSGFNGFSQEEDDDDLMPQDTIGFSTGKIILNNPNSILSAYVYDPVSDRYIFNS